MSSVGGEGGVKGTETRMSGNVEGGGAGVKDD